jgi:hypothetical protein
VQYLQISRECKCSSPEKVIRKISGKRLAPLNPLGVKGVGESGVIPLPAAIASAIEDALSSFDVRIDQIPIKPGYLFGQLERSATFETAKAEFTT